MSRPHPLATYLGRPAALARFAMTCTSFALAGCSPAGTPLTLGGGDTGGTHLVVYSSDRGQAAGQFDLYLYDLDALGFRQIAHSSSATAADLHPTISSDGLVIGFESNRGGAGGSDILLYSRLDQRLIPLAGVNTAADETEPTFTGDAKGMVFTQAQGGARHIRLYDGVGDTLKPVNGLNTMTTASDWSPAPDQTGRRIAFVSDRNGNPDIFVWDDSLKNVLNLPDLVSPGNDVDPTLTPDGHLLCFASDRAGGAGQYDLYLYDLTAKAFIPLPAGVNTTFNERHPSISRGGDYIVFQSDRTSGLGKWDIWNCSRPLARVGQGIEESSTSDDIDPALLYP